MEDLIEILNNIGELNAAPSYKGKREQIETLVDEALSIVVEMQETANELKFN